ncbi:MAG: hypothetical protein ABL971_16965 [Vicinamibacterales bacterium]
MKAVEDGNYQIALDEINNAARLAPADAAIQFALATILDKVGRTEEALAALEKVQAIGIPDAVKPKVDDLKATLLYKRMKAAALQPGSVPPSTPGGSAPGPGAAVNGLPIGELPAGSELDVRLQTALSSGTAAVEDRFEATTFADLFQDARAGVIPVGSVMRGVVTAVEPATRTNRTARMSVSFDQVTVRGRAYPMRGTVIESLVAYFGGVKGAIAGILIGGGGFIAATEGKQVELPPGSVLTVRFDSPLQVNVR